MASSHRVAVPQAAHDALDAGEACTLASVATSEPLRSAQAVRTGRTIIVTAEITATYIYQVHDADDQITESIDGSTNGLRKGGLAG
jgi:hypothetical protein